PSNPVVRFLRGPARHADDAGARSRLPCLPMVVHSVDPPERETELSWANLAKRFRPINQYLAVNRPGVRGFPSLGSHHRNDRIADCLGHQCYTRTPLELSIPARTECCR